MFGGTGDKLIYYQTHIAISIYIIYIHMSYTYASLIAHMLPIKLILSVTGYKPEQSHCSCGSIPISSKKSLPGCDSCGATWRPLLFSCSFFAEIYDYFACFWPRWRACPLKQRAAHNSEPLEKRLRERERDREIECEGMQYDGESNKSKRGNWVKIQLENINPINVVCRQNRERNKKSAQRLRYEFY